MARLQLLSHGTCFNRLQLGGWTGLLLMSRRGDIAEESQAFGPRGAAGGVEASNTRFRAGKNKRTAHQLTDSPLASLPTSSSRHVMRTKLLSENFKQEAAQC